MAVILLPTAPPRRSASWMIKWQYASMSLVLESSEHIAVYAAKQYTHEARDGTSLSLGLRLVVLVMQSDIICQEVTHLDKLPTADPLHQPVQDGVSCQ